VKRRGHDFGDGQTKNLQMQYQPSHEPIRRPAAVTYLRLREALGVKIIKGTYFAGEEEGHLCNYRPSRELEAGSSSIIEKQQEQGKDIGGGSEVGWSSSEPSPGTALFFVSSGAERSIWKGGENTSCTAAKNPLLGIQTARGVECLGRAIASLY